MRSLRLDSVAKAQQEPQSAGARQVRSAGELQARQQLTLRQVLVAHGRQVVDTGHVAPTARAGAHQRVARCTARRATHQKRERGSASPRSVSCGRGEVTRGLRDHPMGWEHALNVQPGGSSCARATQRARGQRPCHPACVQRAHLQRARRSSDRLSSELRGGAEGCRRRSADAEQEHKGTRQQCHRCRALARRQRRRARASAQRPPLATAIRGTQRRQERGASVEAGTTAPNGALTWRRAQRNAYRRRIGSCLRLAAHGVVR